MTIRSVVFIIIQECFDFPLHGDKLTWVFVLMVV